MIAIRNIRVGVIMSKISVIVPVYNSEEFLTESINSILNQSFTDFDVICINDGSTDQSLRMLNNFKKRDSRIKVIDKENSGCGSARNVGIENAEGDYIYFFDPDDFIREDAFEKLYENAKNNDSDMVFSQISWYREGERINLDKPGIELEKEFDDVDFNNFTFTYKDIPRYVINSYFAPWIKLFKKDFLKVENNFRFQENIAFDDVPFHVETIIKAKRISFVPETFYQYRTSNINSVSNTSTNSIDILRICDIVENILKQNNIFEEFKSYFYEFKIVQLILYVISSNSEMYYKSVKYELMKININDLNLPENILERYNRLVNSKNYEEYLKINNVQQPPQVDLTKLNKKLEDEKNKLKDKLNKIIKNNEKLQLDQQEIISSQKEIVLENDRLIEEKNGLTNERKELIRENEIIKNKMEIIENEKHQLERDNDYLITSNKTLKEYNANINKENRELKNENKSLLKNNKELKKVNDLILSSNSWKLTKPLRSIKSIFKK